MKKILSLLIAAVVLLSCGPSRHAIHVEMRYPSKSGIDLGGKVISVVYLENDDAVSASFAGGIADGLAYSLEQDYGTGEGSVAIYRMLRDDSADYSSKDSMIPLLVDTGADVLLLIDTLEIEPMTMGGLSRVASPVSADSTYISNAILPFKLKMYCFDAMDKDEKVYSFGGKSTAAPHAYSNGQQPKTVLLERAREALPEVGFEAGKQLASSFGSQWKHEQYSIVYFDSSQWYKAVAYAEQYEWVSAMDIWLSLLDTNDLMKRSCAAYNIAVACYMSGDYDLASQWLDRSDKDNKLPLSDSLRKRIDSRR